MPISHKIRQYIALLGFEHLGKVLWSAERVQGSHAQAGSMMGFYAPNSGWLSSWGLGIGLFEPGGNLSLVVLFGLRVPCRYPSWQSPPFWFPGLMSAIFSGVVVQLLFCPTPPILTAASSNKGVFVYTENMLFSTAAFINRLS